MARMKMGKIAAVSFSCMYEFSNKKNSECVYDFFGKPACSECSKVNICDNCINSKTTLCSKCPYRKAPATSRR